MTSADSERAHFGSTGSARAAGAHRAKDRGATDQRRFVGSRRLFERASHVFPGGTTRLTLYSHPHPIYLKGGEGAIVVDVDDNSYIDFVNNYAALIHGHRHPPTISAMGIAMESGLSFGAPTSAEVKYAEYLCERYPAIDKVRFTTSGTEALMGAVKAARAYTGKPSIAKAEGAYHGSYDYLEISLESDPSGWGNPRRPNSVALHTHTPSHILDAVAVLPFNDADASVDILRTRGHELAAVVLDPVPPRIGMVLATQEFLTTIREECFNQNIVLIMDEIIAVRLGFHGAHGLLGITPDIVCLGKLIGGGMPIGAFGGRADIMRVFDQREGPKVHQTGTFHGNAMSIAAGRAALTAFDPSAVHALRQTSARLRERLCDAADAAGVACSVNEATGMFRILLGKGRGEGYRAMTGGGAQMARLTERLYWSLLERGIMTSPKLYGYLSTAITEEHVETFASAFYESLLALSRAA